MSMATIEYRALTLAGELVTGSLDASSRGEVNRRIEYLGLIPIEAGTARNGAALASIRSWSRSSRFPTFCAPTAKRLLRRCSRDGWR